MSFSEFIKKKPKTTLLGARQVYMNTDNEGRSLKSDPLSCILNYLK